MSAPRRIGYMTSELMKLLREQCLEIKEVQAELGLSYNSTYQWLRSFEEYGLLICEKRPPAGPRGRARSAYRLSPQWGGK